MQVRLVSEDLDRVLVRPDRAIGAEPEEQRAHRVLSLDVERCVIGEAGVGHVVDDPDREPPLGPLAPHLVEHPRDHPRRELLGGQAVAAADHDRLNLPLAGAIRLAQRRKHVQEQRLAERPRLFAPVEDRDALHGLGQRPRQLGRGERPVQPDLRDSHPLALRLEVGNRLACCLPARAHHDQHALGLRVAAVLDELVAAPGPVAEPVHRALHDPGDSGIERVHGLARLEVDVGVLGSAADERPLGRERPGPVLAHQLV